MEKGRLIIDGVDVSGSVGSAASVPYSNTNSGLEATNVQGAIDELNSNLDEQNKNLGGFTPVIDETTGKITGYKTSVGGADTVFPFNSGIPLFKSWGFNSDANVLYFNIDNYSKVKYTCTTKVSTSGVNSFGVSKNTTNSTDTSFIRLGEATGEYEVDISAYKYLFIDVGYTSFPKFSEFILIE